VKNDRKKIGRSKKEKNPVSYVAYWGSASHIAVLTTEKWNYSYS
jgi:hypothetical protein